MILTLVREQVRAQRTALIWTALVVAGAVGFSTYASVTGATDAAVDGYRLALSPGYASQGALVELTDLGTPNGNTDDLATLTTTTALADQLAQSKAAGSDAWATASSGVGTVLTADGPGTVEPSVALTVMATWGATPWDAILAEGSPPLAGEIAIPADMARALQVGIGDSVNLPEWTSSGDGRIVATPTVSALTYDVGGTAAWPSGLAYVSSADASVLADLAAALPDTNQGAIVAVIGWSTPADAPGAQWPTAWEQRGGAAVMQTGALAPWLVAVTLTVGAVIMAFAVGRTQAAVRVQWTATARALGARRSHLLGAGAVEAAGLFAMALVGVALGYGAALADHGVWRRSFAAPVPVDVSLPWWLIAALVGLALGLAVTSAAIPAVLATRVPPTAALKATSVTDEQELSRRVRVLPVGIGLGVVWVALVQPIGSDPGPQLVWNVLALAAGVLLIALVIEMARRGAEAVGRRWQRSVRPWQMYAGTMLTGHPRQGAALASIHFFALCGIAGWLALHAGGWARVLSSLVMRSSAHRSWGMSNLLISSYGLAVVATLLAVAVLCAAIIASSFRASTAERELAGALGLQPRDVRRAHTASWAAAQAGGALAGAVVGSVLLGTVIASGSSPNAWAFLFYEPGGRLVAFAASIGVALAAGLLATLLSAMLTTRLIPASSPRATSVRMVAP